MNEPSYADLIRYLAKPSGDGQDTPTVEAVAKFQEFQPDITTMDIIMPVKNGIDALSEIMALDAGAKVVMCSAIGQEALTQSAQSAGAKDFILKPFNPERVKEVIKRISGA